MDRGMRLVIGGAAPVAGTLLQAAPAFLPAPPLAGRRRPAPQRRAVRPAPQPAPQQQTRPPQAQQAQPQQKQRPEPFQNVQERAACLNKETQPATLIAACTVLIEAGKDKPAAVATMY